MQRPRLASVHSVTYHAARHQIATSSSGCLLMEPYKVHLSHIMSRRAGVTAGGRWGSDAVPDAIFGGRARIRAVVGPRGRTRAGTAHGAPEPPVGGPAGSDEPWSGPVGTSRSAPARARLRSCRTRRPGAAPAPALPRRTALSADRGR